MVRRVVVPCAIATLVFGLMSCRREPLRVSIEAGAPAVTLAAPTDAAPDPGPIRIADVDVPSDLTAFVLRGKIEGPLRVVFIPGMCVHPRDYMLTFERTAAAHGSMLGVQGDTACTDNGYQRKWTGDVPSMDRRIEAALAAAGESPAKDMTLIGYSQGAERAQWLAARYPEKYTRVVLIASAVAPIPDHLHRVKAAVLMAGQYDASKARMKEGATTLGHARVRATFIEIAGAYHGQMGVTPEATMAEALDFLTQ